MAKTLTHTHHLPPCQTSHNLSDFLAKYEWSLFVLKILKVTNKHFLLLFSYYLFSFSSPPSSSLTFSLSSSSTFNCLLLRLFFVFFFVFFFFFLRGVRSIQLPPRSLPFLPPLSISIFLSKRLILF